MSALPRPAVLALTSLVMAAFAANSVLARLALVATETGAASFTALRLVAGAAMLALVLRLRPPAGRAEGPRGDWVSAAALFAYAAAFSFAYLSLATGTGALLLFGAVQLTMIGWGLVQGERMGVVRWLGIALAMAGLVVLVAPGVEAPPAGAAALMALSGAAWGVYSLRGRGVGAPVAASAGNFWRAAVFGLGLLGVAAVWPGFAPRTDGAGVSYAVLSGTVTSGLGYVLWYRVLPALRAASAATVQLSVPVLAALGGVAFVGEDVTVRLLLATAATLGGIALVVRAR